MRHSEITSATTPPPSTNEAPQTPARNRLRPVSIDAARRAATPHLVTCDGLSRTNLTIPGQFERELCARVRWCEKYAPGDFEIEPIGPGPEQLTGRRCRFARIWTAPRFDWTGGIAR
jgi:hypothetical protein